MHCIPLHFPWEIMHSLAFPLGNHSGMQPRRPACFGGGGAESTTPPVGFQAIICVRRVSLVTAAVEFVVWLSQSLAIARRPGRAWNGWYTIAKALVNH